MTDDRLLGKLPDLIATFRESGIDQKYSYCPDVLAAYLEVVNQISSLGNTLHSIPQLEHIEVALPEKCGSALLKIQAATYRIHKAHASSTPVEDLRAIFLNGGLGADTMATALELLPTLWTPSSTPETLVPDLCTFYIDLCGSTDMSEPRAVALENLADILDRRLAAGKFDDLDSARLTELWTALPFGRVNPSLANAILRVSGCMMAILLQHGKMPASGLQGWGRMLAHAGQDERVSFPQPWLPVRPIKLTHVQDFDTRFAAAGGLRIFFSATDISSATSEDLVPIHLALYDALNDDDDEVRDEAAAAVKYLLGDALTPLEASDRLLSWLSATFPSSDTLRRAVVSRLTGSIRNTVTGRQSVSATAQLDAALAVDDSLFVVEEQNLFVDEAREAARWTAVLRAVHWTPSEAELLATLDSWLREGLAGIQNMLAGDAAADGPLGWASNPQAFGVCSLVLLGSVTMVSAGHASTELRDAVDATRQAMVTRGDVSGLLLQYLQTSN